MKNKKKLIPELRFPEFKNEEEWENPNLSNISNIIMGSSPSSISYNEDKVGLPLLQGNTDIKNRLSAPRIYTTEITKECEVGDVLLSVRAPVGTVAKSLHNACIGRGISALRAIKPNSQEYLYQWLFSYESSWDKISQGGTFNAVNSDDIRNLLIPIPKNPKEQQKIASCLSSIDEVIEAHSQKLELLKDHKKGLMQNLFPQEGEKVPKYRFKEFEDEEEWENIELGKISDIVRGGSPRPIQDYLTNSENGLNWLKIADVAPDSKYITGTKEKVIRKALSSTRQVNPGDLILSNSMSFGRPYILKITTCIHDGWIAIREISNKTFEDYLYYYISSEESQKYFNTNAAGAAVKNLNADIIKLLPIKLSKNRKEQQKIASCLSSLDELILAQTDKIEQLKQHKKGLMQGLFPTDN